MRANLIAFITLFMTITGCNHSYTFQLFAYPPDIAPHEHGWSYLCQVIAWSEHNGPVTRRGSKKIAILIKDKDDKILLRDQLRLTAASIKAKTLWNNFENIQITIYEEGNQFSEDEYNRSLIESGPKLIGTLNYYYDEKSKRFEKSKAEPINPSDAAGPRR